MTLREAARILDAAIRDNSYRNEPIGGEVAKFLRYMAAVRDASPRTLEVNAKGGARHELPIGAEVAKSASSRS